MHYYKPSINSIGTAKDVVADQGVDGGKPASQCVDSTDRSAGAYEVDE